jgi:hypothetical protein
LWKWLHQATQPHADRLYPRSRFNGRIPLTNNVGAAEIGVECLRLRSQKGNSCLFAKSENFEQSNHGCQPYHRRRVASEIVAKQLR